MPTPDAGMPGPSNGKSTADAVAAANKQLLTMESITKRITKLTEEIKKNLGGQTANAMGGTSDSSVQTSGMLARLRGVTKVGGFALGMGIGMLPNTQNAVSQRIMAQGMGSMTGNTPQEIIAMSNRLLGSGVTSSQGGVMSATALASRGIMPGSAGFQNIMGNVGGLSVLTQQNNQDIAAQYGSINSMTFLRAGIMTRDASGNLKSPTDIANDVYNRIIPGGRGLNKDQAATLLNPNSKGFQSLLAITGGNVELSSTLSKQMYFQALNNGKAVNAGDAQNIMDNVLHLQKDDPLRKFYNQQGTESGMLQKTGDSLVKGYGGALDAVAATNRGFMALADVLPGVVDAMGRIAGFGVTLPTVGNTGATLTSASLGLMSKGREIVESKMADHMFNALYGPKAGGEAGAAAKGGRLAGSRGALKAIAPLAIAEVGGLGIEYVRQHGGQERHSKADMLGTAAAWAGTGALAGSFLPGLGTAVGAGLGAAAGLAYGAYKGAYGGDEGAASVTNTTGGGNGRGSSAFHLPSTRPRGVGYGAKPKHKGQWTWKGYHTGQDFLDPRGTPVYAIRDGIVINAKMNANGPAYGNSILIDHGPFQSLYAHLSKIMVKAGAKVKAGQVIGLSGETGTGARGPHLHFEIRKNGNPVNPGSYLAGGAMPKESSISKVVSRITKTVNRNPGASEGDEGDGSQFMNMPSSVGSMFNLSSSGLGTSNEATTSGIGGDVGAGSVTTKTSSLTRGSVNVHLNVNIASASQSDVVRMAQQIKKVLENELNISKIGSY
ncbi:MAG: M23 family metallopeptidase [Fluviibacter sp.]